VLGNFGTRFFQVSPWEMTTAPATWESVAAEEDESVRHSSFRWNAFCVSELYAQALLHVRH